VTKGSVISGFAETAQDAPPKQMMRLLREFGEVILRDPAVAGFGAQTGTTGGAQTANTGRFFIALKPRDEPDLTSSQVIDRLRPELAKVQGGVPEFPDFAGLRQGLPKCLPVLARVLFAGQRASAIYRSFLCVSLDEGVKAAGGSLENHVCSP
jgi:multidrug efflux pump subunit AcrB